MTTIEQHISEQCIEVQEVLESCYDTSTACLVLAQCLLAQFVDGLVRNGKPVDVESLSSLFNIFEGAFNELTGVLLNKEEFKQQLAEAVASRAESAAQKR